MKSQSWVPRGKLVLTEIGFWGGFFLGFVPEKFSPIVHKTLPNHHKWLFGAYPLLSIIQIGGILLMVLLVTMFVDQSPSWISLLWLVLTSAHSLLSGFQLESVGLPWACKAPTTLRWSCSFTMVIGAPYSFVNDMFPSWMACHPSVRKNCALTMVLALWARGLEV